MKRKIILFFIFMLLFATFSIKVTYAADSSNKQPYETYDVGSDIHNNVCVTEKDTLENCQNKLKNISSSYYNDDNDDKHALAEVTVFKLKDEKGNIVYYIGNENEKVQWVNWEEILFDDKDKNWKVGDTWKVWLEVHYQYIDTEDNTDYWKSTVFKTYYDPDGNFNPEENGWEFNKAVNKVAAKTIDKVADVLDGLDELKENFKHNKVGTIITLALDLIRFIFGDSIQLIANMVETTTEGTFPDWHVVYSYNYLKKSGQESKNEYTSVSEYKKQKTKDWQIEQNLTKKEYGEKRFDEDTKIPVMKGDLYNIAVEHISFLDANFLTGQNDRDSNGNPTHNMVWRLLRTIASGITHMAIYIASAIIIMELIISAIGIVKNSFDKPEEKAKCKEKINNLITSVTILVGSVLIMAICIFFCKYIASFIGKNDSMELPIRVNVENAKYSFSTTPTGYARYMAGLEDVDEYEEKALYTFIYIFLAWLNLGAIVIMIGRMFVIWILSVWGPITAASYAINNKNGTIKFRIWVKSYIACTSIQLIISGIYIIMLKYLI